MGDNRLDDQSADRKYFVIVPQIVWALAHDTYDLTLWCVVKMIAGEKGECYISTEDLATLAMMSTGKVSQCRKRLLETGLLMGEIRRDPGYVQAVWHLTIPDLWRRNLELREALGDSLKARIALKDGEASLHVVKPSPDEGKPSQGEAKPSRGETKKNHKEKPTKDNDGAGLAEKQSQAYTLLADFGVSTSVAQRLAGKCSLPDVQSWVSYATGRKLRNPQGFVVSKLEAGEPVPGGEGDQGDGWRDTSEGRRNHYEFPEDVAEAIEQRQREILEGTEQ